jgi:hypothetical protein
MEAAAKDPRSDKLTFLLAVAGALHCILLRPPKCTTYHCAGPKLQKMWPAATDRRGLASTLGQRAVEIDTHDRFVAENYADRACYGPMNKTFGALDAEKQSLHPGLAGSDGEPQRFG